MSKVKYNLFLDDERVPAGVKWSCTDAYTGMSVSFPEPVPSITSQTWHIARSYDEFVEMIERQGVPDVIAFDHDLAHEHYAALINSKDKHVVNYDSFVEKTGYHCAKYLVDHCMTKGEDLPRVAVVHSMNPIGREKIAGLFRCARRYST